MHIGQDSLVICMCTSSREGILLHVGAREYVGLVETNNLLSAGISAVGEASRASAGHDSTDPGCWHHGDNLDPAALAKHCFQQ